MRRVSPVGKRPTEGRHASPVTPSNLWYSVAGWKNRGNFRLVFGIVRVEERFSAGFILSKGPSWDRMRLSVLTDGRRGWRLDQCLRLRTPARGRYDETLWTVGKMCQKIITGLALILNSNHSSRREFYGESRQKGCLLLGERVLLNSTGL